MHGVRERRGGDLHRGEEFPLHGQDVGVEIGPEWCVVDAAERDFVALLSDFSNEYRDAH